MGFSVFVKIIATIAFWLGFFPLSLDSHFLKSVLFSVIHCPKVAISVFIVSVCRDWKGLRGGRKGFLGIYLVLWSFALLSEALNG